MEQSSTIGLLALALSKAQGMMEGAAKTSKNDFFKSRYADLHECLEAGREPLAKNELAVVQTTDTDEKGLWVYTTLIHSSGEWMRGRILMKPKKDDDQATGSSITYGRRYGYAAIIGLAQKDDDRNASVGDGFNTGEEQKKIGKKTDVKPGNTQKKTEEKKTADRETIDKGLAWLEGFKKMPNFTVDMLTVEWEAQGDNIRSMPQEHQAELGIAKNRLETYLINREAGLK